jgi:hypothetical protein
MTWILAILLTLGVIFMVMAGSLLFLSIGAMWFGRELPPDSYGDSELGQPLDLQLESYFEVAEESCGMK